MSDQLDDIAGSLFLIALLIVTAAYWLGKFSGFVLRKLGLAKNLKANTIANALLVIATIVLSMFALQYFSSLDLNHLDAFDRGRLIGRFSAIPLWAALLFVLIKFSLSQIVRLVTRLFNTG